MAFFKKLHTFNNHLNTEERTAQKRRKMEEKIKKYVATMEKGTQFPDDTKDHYEMLHTIEPYEHVVQGNVTLPCKNCDMLQNAQKKRVKLEKKLKKYVDKKDAETQTEEEMPTVFRQEEDSSDTEENCSSEMSRIYYDAEERNMQTEMLEKDTDAEDRAGQHLTVPPYPPLPHSFYHAFTFTYCFSSSSSISFSASFSSSSSLISLSFPSLPYVNNSPGFAYASISLSHRDILIMLYRLWGGSWPLLSPLQLMGDIRFNGAHPASQHRNMAMWQPAALPSSPSSFPFISSSS